MPYMQEHDARSASAARYTHEFGLSMLARACARGFESPPPSFSGNGMHIAPSRGLVAWAIV